MGCRGLHTYIHTYIHVIYALLSGPELDICILLKGKYISTSRLKYQKVVTSASKIISTVEM